MKPSRASLISLTQLEEDPVFTLAVISRSDDGELWRVEKDSASLAKLDSRMKQFAGFTTLAPDRNLFTGHAPAKVDARRVALEQYMDEVLNTPFDIATALELCKYLSTNTLPPNADETGATGASGEGSAHMIGPDGRPIRSGYLTKRGKNFGGWKSRFFLLDGPLLKYYETPGGAHLGTIKLQSAQIGKQSQSSDSSSPTQGGSSEDMESQYRHAFLILEPKKKDSSSHVKHVLCAESDKERDLWVDALVQWVDYRDPDDDEPLPSSKTNGQAKSGSGRQGGAKSKKGSGNHSKSSHQPSDSDTLVGVRYDSTQAGEAPQSSSSGRPKTSAGPGDHSNLGGDNTMSSQAKLISGPKDPQPIADTAAWGNKTNLAPSQEEKKVRKRSFFGFGPKTRTHSDGQDSIPGVGDLSSSTPPPSQSRQVFGAQLAEAVRFNPPRDVNVPLPSVVYRCIEYLGFKDAVLEEGIFRLSGSNIVIRQLREKFNTEGDVNLVRDEEFLDIHAVASLLKLYLRELPTTILTRDLHMDFLGTIEIQDRKEKLAALAELAQRLPLANATLLKYLISFLIKIINNADMNKMTVRNVGIVFSPTLNIPAPVFAMFLQNYEPIFGIAPEDYELPMGGSEADGRGQYEAQGRMDPPPVRPSTSSGTSSPHRQPRLDSMRDYQRSTPTPPPLSNLNPARASPTPGQARGYEQSYYPQQGMGGASGQRPGYETGYGAPAQHDGYNLYPSTRGPHGYDRPQYQQGHDDSSNNTKASGLTVQDAGFGSGNRSRRESSMYIGSLGLQPQSSKSRLREETRY
jgi:RalA-binding protein 1